ncbi:MAG: methylmalonyl-CoA epimerase [Coprothermobacterota bacterium]|nr:methylmalonyl-CoA epimerase [Coprothermobacterota bacterium]
MLKKIDHIGIAVLSIEETGAMLEKLGLIKEGEEEIASQKLRVAFFNVGGVRIELLEPTSPESTVSRFLEAKGQSVHHIAYETEDVDAEQQRLLGEGFVFINETPQPGAHGARTAFLHPKATGKILTELVEHPAGGCLDGSFSN